MINRNFTLLLAGQMISQIGDKFHMIALSFWVLKTTGSSAKMGVVLAASLIPGLVLGFFSGAMIDRYNRKFIIVGADVMRGLIIFMFAGLFYFGQMNFTVILIMQILLSVNTAFFDPAIPSVIPGIVRKKDLARANSKHQFVNGFSMIAGAFLGGICVSVFGYVWVFAANAVSFLISAGFECLIRIPRHSKEAVKIKGSTLLGDIKKGYLYIFSRKEVCILLFMVMIIHFFVGSMEVFMPVIAHTLAEEGEKILGFFHTAFGLGTIIMAFLLSIAGIAGKEKSSLFISVFFMGFLYVAASFFSGNKPVVTGLYLFMIFLFGCSIICAGISFKTLLQKSIDNEFAGRVFAVTGSIANASIPAAMILYGLLMEKVEIQGLLLVSGVILMLLSVISFVMYKEKKYGRAIETFSKSVT